MNEKRYILCAAIWFDDQIKHEHQPTNIESGYVICGHRHHNCFMTSYILNNGEKVKGLKETQGFLTNENKFVTREVAAKLAYESGQTDGCLGKLFSEDLY